MLTRQKLYVTENNEQVYYIVRSSGQDRSRHAYRLSVRGDNCIIYNGVTEMALQFDMLMPGRARSLRLGSRCNAESFHGRGSAQGRQCLNRFPRSEFFCRSPPGAAFLL